jgi:hypothetical protein
LERERRPSSTLRTAAVIFALLWLLFATWAMATPLFGAPDEPAQVVRAASVVRGQILGKPTTVDAFTEVRAPAIYEQMARTLACWTFKPDETPACGGAFQGSQRVETTTTYVGRYDPAYYALVGFPTLLSTDEVGVYAVRLLSAALAAALMTLAVLACLRARRPSLALVGLGFALTPMTMFLAGTVNPSGMEVTAAICLWVTGLLILDPARRRTYLVVWAVIAACLLVVSRGLSPLWLAVILGLQALVVVRDPRRTILGDRRMVGAALVVGASAVAAGLWTVFADALAVLPVGEKLNGPLLNVSAKVLGQTRAFLEEMIGVLGWLDTRGPFFTYLLWFVGVAALVLLALATASWRARLALVACVALTLLSPLLALPSIRTAGAIWQGRYALPLAVGIPILATHALAAASEEVAAVLRRLGMFLVVGMGIAVVGAFLWAGRRNSVGVDGTLFYFGREEWRPPVPTWLLMLVFTATVGALVTLFLRLAGREQRSAPAGPASPL